MKVYEVGGCVRDEQMGVQPKDRDWVVVNSSPAEMEQKGFKPIGKDFPVFLHPKTKEEYALARTEKKSGTGYKDFTFYFDTNVTLEEDLRRRDLTINAMAKDSNGNIVDPYGGKEDIKNKIFRHTSDAFSEDPLRALRLARFSTYEHFKEFRVANETVELLNEIVNSGELSSLSGDRVWMETFKAISEPGTDRFFETLLEHNLLEPWFVGLNQVSIDGMRPEYKWAELQRVNEFQICAELPVPNTFKKVIELYKVVLKLMRSSVSNEKIQLIEKLNIPRNNDDLEELFQLKELAQCKEEWASISNAVLGIDFTQLVNFKGNAVSEKKQFLYHEALKLIL